MRVAGTSAAARRQRVVVVASEQGAMSVLASTAGAPCDIVVRTLAPDEWSDWVATCAKLAADAGTSVLLVVDESTRASALDACANGVDHVLVAPVSAMQMMTSIEVALGRAESRSAKSGVHPVDLEPTTPDAIELSAREREVLTLLGQGHRAHDIGKALFISHHTARNHIKTVFRKFGVHSHVELLQRLRNGAGP